jgi:hypothetical protein
VDDSANDILVQFDVARELDPASAAPGAKPADAALTTDESTGNKPDKDQAKDPRVEQANAKHEEDVKRKEAAERQRKFKEREAEELKALEQAQAMNQPRPGAGGGMGGMGMGGMGGMGGMRNNSHLPPSYNIDFGLNTLFGGLRRAGRATIDGVSSKVAGMTVDVEQRAALLNTSADDIVAIRERLQSGKNDAGEALTADELLQNWGGLKDAVQNIKTGLKGVARLPDGKITDDLVASLKHASKAVNDTKPLVDETAKKPGKVGEAAKEVQEAMNKIVEALMKLVKMLMSAFSKDKSAAPEL